MPVISTRACVVAISCLAGGAHAQLAAPELQAYTQDIPGSKVRFDLVPVPAGAFTIGSPDREKGRKRDEGPQRRVRIEAFWIGRCEVTWDEYELWQLDLDLKRRKALKHAEHPNDRAADAVTRPTPPYVDMTFGMGQHGYPAICMTQLAAKYYCEWLSAKTGHYFRLPTEAEWEYACRAGTTTAYHFGDDAVKLGDYAWFAANSEERYHKVGLKKPNPWGIHDMHGNVSEWTLDAYLPDAYAKLPADAPARAPYVQPVKLYPRVARGGSWQDPAPRLRAAARLASHEDWKMQDPQIPQSIWYHTDAEFLGFRVVRPRRAPTEDERRAFLAVSDEERKRIAERKR